MEGEILSANHLPGVLHRTLPAIIPVLMISIGYVDPGKWVATVEGSARFGSDLVAFVFVFNFAAILCQYLAARIGVVTGRDLAEICSDEYDTWTCIFLGVQTELSAIVLDLNMVLGVAHGLNLLFGWDLFTCVFLTSVDAVLLPLLAILLENWKAKFLCLCMASIVLVSFVLGLLISQPEIPLSMNGMLTKLSGESAFALMSLLGANIMPHNFYLHSSIVQWQKGPTNISKDVLCHHHFLAILCVFSGIYLVNYVLMNAAANLFYSTGLLLLTFQDALSLMEQVFRSPVAPFAFLLVLFLANQVTALTWCFGGQVVLHGFLKLDIPGWLHYATVRIIAVVPALYCVWTAGAEGMYQLLISTQVLVALLLPSSVIPLFRVAGSRPVMGEHKISQFVEFLALVMFIGMLGLNIIFMVEMIFGSSDWASNLRWNTGNGISVSYVVLVVIACASFCLMLWLAATPLKSASVGLDAQVWNWDMPKAALDSINEREESNLTETRYHGDTSIQKQVQSLDLGKVPDYSDVSVANIHLDQPQTIMKPDQEPHLTMVEEKQSSVAFSSSATCFSDEFASTLESEQTSTVANEISDAKFFGSKTMKIETTMPIEKTLEVEGDIQAEGDDDEADSWDTEEPSKAVSVSAPSLTSEGPPSFRSLSGKSNEGGNSIGSLSRLAGLGRAARRQLAAILDEFWGQLYDFHGQGTQDAKAKKLDVLFGLDSKPTSSSLKVDAPGKEYSEFLPSLGGRGSDTLMKSSLYDLPNQPGLQSNMESPYGIQGDSSSSWTNHMQLLDAYVKKSSPNILDSSERRYSSVRNLPSAEARDYQPATVHGYQIASYLGRAGKDRNSDNLNGQMESTALKSVPLGTANYRSSLAFALGQKLQNGSGIGQPPGFERVAASRNSQLQSEQSCYDFRSSGPAVNVVTSVNTKKYHSLPSISGYAIPQRDIYASDRSSKWDGSIGYGSSGGGTSYEPSYYSNPSRAGAPLAFDELSPSRVYRDVLSSQLHSGLDTGSLWSRQPFEQFGLASKIHNVGIDGIGSRQSSVTQETTSVVDSEAKLLQSFRHCIVKLLKLEGSDWLFSQNDGADEDLIDHVAAREKFLYEAETREMNRVIHVGEAQYLSDRNSGSVMKNNEANFTSLLVTSVPHCGEGCIWRSDLIVSFGVWCIHRILDLSLMESRPELWGKYTYVLNRLQGIVDPAFSRPRSPMTPCFCLQVPLAHQQKSSPPVSNGMLPPAAKPARGKCTTAAMLLDLIRDVETAISCRKGRTGTAAGDVAFPKGKENLASVLKRYKRRLSNKQVSFNEGTGSRKVPTSGA
ncbi:ethylene-insensitive protein 2 [Quillaja saponaria]|uniref:Ethylene-insensitive protein 2 n=1 Tax=Quillaja saponaria TaxID=32244 RepID=A0AAD7Q8P6_QUISA|nr:ethylene-insensitive protein 2 [Quillaja saponaria]KAJ7976948.1 ethylene-insensitive protein 2 [Quillaja saponaria]